MADFVAVLKKTIDGLGESTPDVREKVYQKARTTIGSKLAAMNPPPPAAVIDRQRKALEDAIRQVEADYLAAATPPEEDPLEELDALFSSLSKTQAPAPQRPAARQAAYPAAAAAAAGTAAAKPQPAKAAPQQGAELTPPIKAELAPPAKAELVPPVKAELTSPAKAELAPPAKPAPAPAAQPALDGFKPVQPKPAPTTLGLTPLQAKPAAAQPDADPVLDDEDAAGRRDAFDDRDPPADPLDGDIDIDESRFGGTPQPVRRERSGFVKLLAGTAAALLVFGGIGYALWTNQDRVAALIGGSDPVVATPASDAPAAAPDPLPQAEEEDVAALAPEPVVEPEPEPVVEPEPAAPAPLAAEEDTTPKFTQRLNTDGTEIDAGPAGGEATVGEGTSVAAATQAAEQPAPAAAEEPTAIPVGQRAIFYEERTSVAQGSAEPGATVWSLVQESPGNDLPPEPAIRAEASIPGKDIQLRMTIRRNADETLPASHIVELIFLTPDNFAGGAVDNVLRMTMKETEEAAGSPMQGIPAKIADGFFLIALDDGQQARDANIALMRRQNWIDVPIVYKSGRRALMTMEKGLPGEKVFEQAMKAWQDATSG
jgi:hypothetical protein